MYDYGARSYDARMGVWLSPDPILADYMANFVDEGPYQPGNLQLYSMTRNNPLSLVDPDGRLTYDAQQKLWMTDDGDSLESISDDASVGLSELRQLNPGLADQTLAAGQEVMMPRADNIETLEFAGDTLGSTDWARHKARGEFKEDSNKCNLYVSEGIEASGRHAPRHYAYGVVPTDGPATAGELADRGGRHDNSYVVEPRFRRAGQLLAFPLDTGATGHVVIYTGRIGFISQNGDRHAAGGDGTIGAGRHTVNYRTTSYLSRHGYTRGTYRSVK